MRIAIAFLLLFLMTAAPSTARRPDARAERIAWVGKCLKQLQTVRVGSRRNEVEKTLTTEGGISSPSSNHYVSRECPYFKVDVEYQTKPNKDGRAVASPNDPVVKVSRPYLEWEIMD